MKWLKQSFAFLKNHPKETLILCVLALLVLYISSFITFFGAALTSLGLVFLQAGIFQTLSEGPNAKIFSPAFLVRPSMALLLAAFILIPTNIMMGSISGLAQGSESMFLALFMIAVFSVMCALAYLVIAHTIGFIVIKNLRFGLALEAALQGVGKNRQAFGVLSCLSAAALLLSVLPFGMVTGVGLVITLPMHFYVYYFSFQDFYPATKAAGLSTRY